MDKFVIEKQLRDQRGQMALQSNMQQARAEVMSSVTTKHEQVVAAMQEVRSTHAELKESGMKGEQLL